MIIIFIIILEFILIFLLSRQIFTLLYTLFYLPLKPLAGEKTGGHLSRNLATLLFLPGTAIHEFSHAVVAKILDVEVDRIILYPHKDRETGELKAGAIEIAKANSFKLSLIGIAPVLSGLAILSLTVLYLFNFSLPPDELSLIWEVFAKPENYPLFLLVFVVSTTMFASRRDLKEFFITLPAVVIILILLYLAGFRISLNEKIITEIQKILEVIGFILGITFLVDLLIYIFLLIPLSLLGTILRFTIRKR